jgi:hypothetical protein
LSDSFGIHQAHATETATQLGNGNEEGWRTPALLACRSGGRRTGHARQLAAPRIGELQPIPREARTRAKRILRQVAAALAVACPLRTIDNRSNYAVAVPRLSAAQARGEHGQKTSRTALSRDKPVWCVTLPLIACLSRSFRFASRPAPNRGLEFAALLNEPPNEHQNYVPQQQRAENGATPGSPGRFVRSHRCDRRPRAPGSVRKSIFTIQKRAYVEIKTHGI